MNIGQLTLQYFERLLETSKKQKHSLETDVLVNKKYLRAPYEASYLITNAKKPFTIGEDLVLPVAIRMTEIIHGQKYADELKKNPLSNDTVGQICNSVG